MKFDPKILLYIGIAALIIMSIMWSTKKSNYTAAELNTIIGPGTFVNIYLRRYIIKNEALTTQIQNPSDPSFTLGKALISNLRRLRTAYKNVTKKDILFNSIGITANYPLTTAGDAQFTAFLNNKNNAINIWNKLHTTITNNIPDVKNQPFSNDVYLFYTFALESKTSCWDSVYPDQKYVDRAIQDGILTKCPLNPQLIDDKVNQTLNA